MGNQNSKAEAGGGSVITSQAPNNNNVPSRRNPRRRDSIQTLPSVKSTAASPSASLDNANATSQPSQPSPPQPPQSPQSRTTPPAHFRSRSQTITIAEMGNEHSRQKSRDTTTSSSTRRPPAPDPVRKPAQPSPVDTSAPPQDHVFFSPPQYIRPPRLPLPIETEPVVAGSPIISPEDLLAPVEPGDTDGELPRKTSLLSTLTGDDDYPPDEPHLALSDRPAIPTLVEWSQGGHKVYVTGTFTNWDKKYRLHRDPKNENDVLSAMVPIPPGTHHLKFIVDGDMRTSDKMPTAVDDYGILVNYLEVTPEPPATQPMDIPHGERRAPPGVFPPQVLPPTPEIKPTTPPVSAEKPGGKVTKQRAKMYHREIPQYLLDAEYFAGEEESPIRLRGQAAADSQPAPPTLPGFLGKSILNATQQMKDDASVLIYPNHTVLNHLGTSSIKNGVIATSATTRYKRKYVTTILHKPVSDTD